MELIEVPLHAVAHSRAGDKGNRANLSLMPYDPALWPMLAEQVTEERVLAVIEQYQYVPNMVARGLRRNASQIVGIIVPDITNEFFARIVLQIQIKLFERNYSAVICNTNENAHETPPL